MADWTAVKQLLVPWLVPAVGAMGFYAGGLMGAWFTAGRFAERPFVMFLAVVLCGATAAFAFLLAIERVLAPESSGVDTLKTLGYITGGALLVLALRKLIGHGLPPFLEHLVVWGAGVHSVFSEKAGQSAQQPAR